MKKLISFIVAFVMAGALATSVYALPGSSVSIGGAEFNFGSNSFSAGGGSGSVVVTFYDPSSTQTALFTNAQLIMTPVNFSGGLTNGTGGGFSILTSGSVPLLTGVFGSGSSLSNPFGSVVFEASVVTLFTNPNIVLAGTQLTAPGTFSATMNILSGPFDSSWTSTGSATASISSVPEPASLMLLGAGLAGIGIWSWRRKSTKS